MYVGQADLFIGSVLRKLMSRSSEAPRLIEDTSDGRAIYSVDGLPNRQKAARFFIKYSATPKGDGNGGHWWRFSFSSEDLRRLNEQLETGDKTYVILVCGRQDLKGDNPLMRHCVVSEDRVPDLVDLSLSKTQRMRVDDLPNKQLRVSGPQKKRTEPLLIPADQLEKLVGDR